MEVIPLGPLGLVSGKRRCGEFVHDAQDDNKAMESPDSPLVKHMTALIRETGPLTFARFMELALYDDEHGYYTTGGGRSVTATSFIGREGGDFFTAPSLSPVLAKCLVRQLAEIDERLGHPPVFHLVEMGPGDGTLLRDLLQECREQQASLFPRLSCILVERSPAFRRRQRETLAAWQEQGAGIRWVDDLQSIPDESLTGTLLSNELVDAFPVHRVRMGEDGLQELYVTGRDHALQERWGEPSTPELASFLSDLDVDVARRVYHGNQPGSREVDQTGRRGAGSWRRDHDRLRPYRPGLFCPRTKERDPDGIPPAYGFDESLSRESESRI